MYTYICDNNIVVFARSSQSVFRSIVLLFITLVINERLPFRCALFVKSIDVTSREKLLFVIRNSTNILYIFSFYDFLQSPYIIKKYLHVASPRLAVTVRVMVFLNVRVRVLKKKKKLQLLSGQSDAISRNDCTQSKILVPSYQRVGCEIFSDHLTVT